MKGRHYCFFLILLYLPTLLSAETLQVGEGRDYNRIYCAIEAANAHDSIIVHQGVYTESDLRIDKPIYIEGRNNAILDIKNQKAQGFIVYSDSVTIRSMTIRNIGISYLTELAAIKVIEASAVKILNNTIELAFFGIYLEHAEDITVENNHVEGNAQNEASAGNAIHIWNGKNTIVKNNELHGHRDGIYFEFVDSSLITGNKSYNNLRYGLHFMFSDDDTYSDNVFEDNGSGVAVMFSHRIKMVKNTFIKNWGGASYGLLLKEISDGKIYRNHFIENTIGILAEGANRLLINENTFKSNGKAMNIQGNCIDNTIMRNNFIGNTFEVITNTRHNNNSYEANYWSQYRGYDLDRDGVGDIGYRPVSLFAKITDQVPAANILIHSVLVNLLETGERIFPSIIPEGLIDDKPQIEPYSYD